MYKSLSLVLAISVISAMGYAQTANLDNEVDAELNQMYSASQPAAVQAQKVEVPQAAKAQPIQVQQAATAQPTQAAEQTAQTTAPVSAQPIYILNQATPTANSQSTSTAANIQKQPTTVVEATPLTESRAEALRKAREEAETNTEAKIVEKLEQSRLDDEKRRAQALFGDKLNGSAQQANPEQAPAAAPQPQVNPQIIIIPQQVAAPAAPAADEVKKEDTSTAEAEVKEADKTEAQLAASMPVVPPAPVVQKYFSGIIGVPTIDGDQDVQGNYSLGFTFGNKYNDSYAVEGSFIYSNYESKNVNGFWNYGTPTLFDVNQYSGVFAGKVYLMQGMVKPLIGGLAQYSYREFVVSDKNYYKPNPSKSDSHSVDLGAMIGVEVEFSPTMTVGLDARYMKNLVVRRNYSTDSLSNNYYQNQVNYQWGYRTPIENLDYYTLSLSAKMTF